MSFVAMPMTCHPSLERDADVVRGMIEAGHWHIRFMVPKPHVGSYSMASAPVSDLAADIRILTVKKAAGGAPFVGDLRVQDARYVWRVAQDDAGRWVAADAELVWRDRY